MGVALGNATDNIINIDSSGVVTISSIISGSSKKLTLGGAGSGGLILSGANTLSGDIRINITGLRLTGGGTIAFVPNIIAASGTTFDVSTLTVALTLAGGQKLWANGATSAATNFTAASKGLTVGTGGLVFTNFTGSIAPLSVAGGGSITLAAGNSVTVHVANGGSPLGAGDYKLISKGSGNTTAAAGSAPTSVTVTGDGVSGTASLVITSGELFLHVVAAATPSMRVILPGQSAPNTGTPTAQTAGTAFGILLIATTDGTTTNAVYTVSSQPITFSGPSGSPSYPATVNFLSGVGSAVITLTAAETTTITANDGFIGATPSSSLVVNPGAINSYVVTAPTPQLAGVPFNVTVTAKDANNNTVTTDSATSVTMSSASGNVVFDSNGDSTFNDSAKTLTSGTFTISAKDSTAETTTIHATDGSKTGDSGSVVVNPVPKYQTRQSGSWSDFATWQVDTGGGFVDAIAGQTPTSTADTIVIRNGHSVTNTSSVTVDQVTVQNGGLIYMNSAFTVNDGTGDDIVVQNGGIFVLPTASTPPSFNSGATARIEGGGILRVASSGLTANGTGVNAANFVYGDASILEFATAAATFSASGVTYFPNVNASTIPIFRVTALGGNPGGSANTAINGVFEAATAVTWTGGGAKTFRNGIRGAGNVSASSSGRFIINGATADLGGAGTLTIPSVGMVISETSVTTLSSDKTVIASADVLTVVGALDLNGKTLTGALTVADPVGTTGILKGNGTITGLVTNNNSGTIAPGNSIGTITLASAPSLTGTNLMEINKSGVTYTSDKIALTSGTLSYGGTLKVTLLGGSDALTGGEVFDLFDAPALTGVFAATNLPALSAGLNWYTNKLTVDGTIIINRAPTASAASYSCAPGLSVGVQITGTGGLASDADGDTLTVTKTSPANGTATLVVAGGNKYIYYLNNGTAGADSFDYTVDDGRGGNTSQTISLTVANPNSPTANNLSITPTGNPGEFLIKFLGIPTYNYALEYTTDASPTYTWTTLGTTQTADATGLVQYTVTPGVSPTYYRTRWVP